MTDLVAWDDYYMTIAMAVRRRANCTGNRVGAVLVKDNRIISTGYNGTSEGMANCLDGGCLRCQNPGGQFPTGHGYDLCICVHAEQNALLAAARFGIAVEGATLYSTMQPCFGCAKAIVQCRINEVIYLHPWTPHDENSEMLAKKKTEYNKMVHAVPMRRLALDDPQQDWAVSARRRAKSDDQ